MPHSQKGLRISVVRRKAKFPHLLGSRWTAIQPLLGWRHFQVRTRHDQKGGVVFAELEAVCDVTVRVWVNAKVLQNRRLWQVGWLSLQPDDGLMDGARLESTQPPPER